MIGSTVDFAYFDQGYTGAKAAEAAGEHGIRREVVNHPTAKRGFFLLSRGLDGRMKLARVARSTTRKTLRAAWNQHAKGIHHVSSSSS